MDDYGNDFVVLTDEEGNEQEFEHIDTLEKNGQTYMAFIPALDTPEEKMDDPAELIILRLENDEDGEEVLVSIDSETELEDIYNEFVLRIDELYDFEDDTGGEDSEDA